MVMRVENRREEVTQTSEHFNQLLSASV